MSRMKQELERRIAEACDLEEGEIIEVESADGRTNCEVIEVVVVDGVPYATVRDVRYGDQIDVEFDECDATWKADESSRVKFKADVAEYFAPSFAGRESI